MNLLSVAPDNHYEPLKRAPSFSAKVALEGERDYGIERVVRFHGDPELVRACHPRVHLGSDLQRSGLSRIDGRRTDDRLRRSAAFYDVYGRALGESHGLGPQVPIGVGSFYGRIQGNSTDVVDGLLEHEA